jgi:putative membrane protein
LNGGQFPVQTENIKEFVMKRKQVLALLLAAAMTANMAMPARAALAAPVSGSIFYQSESVKTVTEEDLAAALAAAVKSNGEEDESNGAEKEETVYVFTDASGRQKSMTVSSWLKNKNGADKLYDNSILENIENVKGDEPFTQSGDILTWNAAGNDIYYQGTTDKQPPVTQKITYYLDGKEIAPEDLAGKSGKVRIHIDYENTEKYEDVYVPFTTVTGIIFSNDNAGNVEVDNGSVISEGKNTVVVGMAFPGLADSLQVVKDDAEHLLEETEASQKSKDRVNDIEIPDSVDITLDATEFKMNTCMTMVFSGLLDDDEEED